MLLGKKTIGTIALMGGIPSVPTPFLKSWQQMIEFNSEYFVGENERIFYNHATVSYHSFARNSLVDQMQGEWLMMFDTDLTFEPDIAMRMWEKMSKFDIDVLVAPYLYKSPPHPPVLYGYNPKTKAKTLMGNWQRENVDLVPIRAGGAGCLLVRKRVFERIKAKLGQSPFDIYFDKGSPMSEDHSFFERLWKLEIPAYACPDLFVNHLIYKELHVDKDYEPKNQLLRKEKILPFWTDKWKKPLSLDKR